MGKNIHTFGPQQKIMITTRRRRDSRSREQMWRVGDDTWLDFEGQTQARRRGGSGGGGKTTRTRSSQTIRPTFDCSSIPHPVTSVTRVTRITGAETVHCTGSSTRRLELCYLFECPRNTTMPNARQTPNKFFRKHAKKRVENATLIQKQRQIDVSEALILGLDSVVIAGTGAGKTIPFMLPVMLHPEKFALQEDQASRFRVMGLKAAAVNGETYSKIFTLGVTHQGGAEMPSRDLIAR
ncbi:hypothetical protein R3P38DRAFT_2777274 [Favolaschia claudopus]|uniref:DEAD/DEAH box helicase domain-containing protein n=1 Tax=Favolaschia claudopus TaxID=2862362 RepID=A0AAW0BLC2_9AGAR